MPKGIKVKICPSCGSTNVSFISRGSSLPLDWCKHCNCKSPLFPETIIDNPEEVEEIRENEAFVEPKKTNPEDKEVSSYKQLALVVFIILTVLAICIILIFRMAQK
tara:strand:+ start:6206 stop:6523 length:318 start_codon:yes stop_codon:yes gene_type:complete